MLLVAGVAYESEQALAVQRGFVYIAYIVQFCRGPWCIWEPGEIFSEI